MVGPPGIEPGRPAVSGRCRPTWLGACDVVVPGGVEPPASCLSHGRSRPLSYRTKLRLRWKGWPVLPRLLVGGSHACISQHLSPEFRCEGGHRTPDDAGQQPAALPLSYLAITASCTAAGAAGTTGTATGYRPPTSGLRIRRTVHYPMAARKGEESNSHGKPRADGFRNHVSPWTDPSRRAELPQPRRSDSNGRHLPSEGSALFR